MSGIREATISALQGAQLTRHFGRPTRKAVKLVRKELGMLYAAAKTTHEDFLMGERFGYAAAVLTSNQFTTAYNRVCQVGDELDDQWEFIIPQQPSVTDPDIDDTTTDADRRRMTAEWRAFVDQWERFDGYEYVFKVKLEASFDGQYFATLRDDLLGYTHVCVSEMLDHLMDQCIALTDVEKQEKLDAVLKPWNQDDDITTFFNNIDRMQEDLGDDDIEWTDSQKSIHAIKQMYASNTFDARDMRGWERKPTPDKTWVHLQSYFGDLYTDVKKYENATGTRHGFESAANVRESTAPPNANDVQLHEQLTDIAMAATADKEYMQQMSNCTDELLAIIKQQQEQITELMRQNGQLISKLGKAAPADSGSAAKAVAAKAAAAVKSAATQNNGRRSAPPGLEINPTFTNAEKVAAKALANAINSGTKSAAPRGPCTLCKKHFGTIRCFELDANKHLRPEGWKSLFE